MNIQTAIKTLIEGINISRDESRAVMNSIMSGETTDAQIAAYLTALRIKGETVDEISGSAEAMAANAEHFAIDPQNVVDTCGTGGDGTSTFNISTTAALIASGAGVKIAKHGNRSVSSHCGSADILKALGVNIEIDLKKFIDVFNKIGVAFMFAPLYHKAMKYAIGPRRELGVRTIFNVLGPLTNPARVKRQIIGVFDKELCNTLAHVLKELGSEHVLVVHGHNGLDEISISGPTSVSELKNGEINNYTIKPQQFGIEQADLNNIQSPDCETNKKIILNILNGKKSAAYDVALINAAASIYVSGIANSLNEGIELAAKSISNGEALNKLNQLITETNNGLIN
jgi:anthranilate phosphoribosyltransferase